MNSITKYEILQIQKTSLPYSGTIIQDWWGSTSKPWSGCASTLLREQAHFCKTDKYKLQTQKYKIQGKKYWTQITNVRSVRYNSCAPRLFLHEITLSRAPLPVDSPKQPKHRGEMQTLNNLQNPRFNAFDLDAINPVISKKMHRTETQGFLAHVSMGFGKDLYD